MIFINFASYHIFPPSNSVESSRLLSQGNRKKEDDVLVYLGKLQNVNGEYSFTNEEKGWTVSLDEEQLSRINPVSDDLKEMLLNADYALSMSMGELPKSNSQDFNETGMKWHK